MNTARIPDSVGILAALVLAGAALCALKWCGLSWLAAWPWWEVAIAPTVALVVEVVIVAVWLLGRDAASGKERGT
jgi:hypothetical protein